MTLFNQPNLSAGIDDTLVDVAQEVPIFPVMLLVFIFSVILIGGSSNQKRRIGTADIPFWAVLASMATTLVSLIMTLGDGLIDITTLGIVIGITIMCSLWFFLSKVRGEQ